MRSDPMPVTNAKPASRDDVELIIRKAHNRQISLDSAALIAKLGINCPAGFPVNICDRQMVEESGASASLDFEFGERALLKSDVLGGPA